MINCEITTYQIKTMRLLLFLLIFSVQTSCSSFFDKQTKIYRGAVETEIDESTKMRVKPKNNGASVNLIFQN